MYTQLQLCPFDACSRWSPESKHVVTNYVEITSNLAEILSAIVTQP